MKRTPLVGLGFFCVAGVVGGLEACSSSSSPATTEEDASTGGHDSGHGVTHRDAGGDAGKGKGPDAGSPKKDTGTPGVDAGHGVDAGEKPDVATKGPDAGVDAPPSTDAPARADTGPDAHADAGPTRHVLVTYNDTADQAMPSVVFAVNLTTHAIDGTLSLADPEVITDTSNAVAPFVLSQSKDVVDELDPSGWTIDSSWGVPLPVGAGGYGSDPYAISVAANGKGYVIRYETNVIDILDTATAADGGAPVHSIDLSSLVEPTSDGLVHAAAAVYVESSNLLYVALQNLNLDVDDEYMGVPFTPCAGTSTVIAIDTLHDAVKSLGGTGKGGGVELAGYDPIIMSYDEAGGRLFLFEEGCKPEPTRDAGAPGALRQAGVEALDLATNTSKVLLDTSAVAGLGFPSSFAYVGPSQAVLGYGYPTSAYKWTTTSPTLGDPIAGAPDVFDYDGNGNLVGASVIPSIGDAGATTNIVSVSIATGEVTTLQSNFLTLGEGFVTSVGVWPRP